MHASCTRRHAYLGQVSRMHRPRSGRREKVPAGPPQAHRLVAGGWTADLAGGGDVTCRGPGAANSRGGGGGGVVGSSGVADFYPCPGRNATSLKALLTWQSEATVPLVCSWSQDDVGQGSEGVGTCVGPGATRRERNPAPSSWDCSRLHTLRPPRPGTLGSGGAAHGEDR